MAVKIRLARQGRKKLPIYSIVAVDSESRRDGKVLERLGQYRPKEADPKKKVQADLAAVGRWKEKGAIVSETVGQLLRHISD